MIITDLSDSATLLLFKIFIIILSLWTTFLKKIPVLPTLLILLLRNPPKNQSSTPKIDHTTGENCPD
jgi:hypothetical protein